MGFNRWVGIGLCMGLLELGSCASAKTRIFPREGGDYLLVASSYSESAAYDAAVEDGTEYCRKQGKTFVMVDEKSEYKGMDKDAKVAIGVAGAVLGQPQVSQSTRSMDDNKVSVSFRCK
jgi:hypothetical protein